MAEARAEMALADAARYKIVWHGNTAVVHPAPYTGHHHCVDCGKRVSPAGKRVCSTCYGKRRAKRVAPCACGRPAFRRHQCELCRERERRAQGYVRPSVLAKQRLRALGPAPADPTIPLRVCFCGKSFVGKTRECQGCIGKRWRKKNPNAQCIDCRAYPRPGTPRCRSCTIKHRARVKRPCKCGRPHFVKKLCRTCYKRKWINRTPLTREYELKKKREYAKRRYHKDLARRAA